MRQLVLIGIGSFIGGAARYLVSFTIQSWMQLAFPFGTLSVNLLGCFLIGLLLGWSDRGALPAEARLFLVTGFCGGFTTFSAFSNETLSLLRGGEWLLAFSYVGASLMIGIMLTFIGYILTK